MSFIYFHILKSTMNEICEIQNLSSHLKKIDIKYAFAKHWDENFVRFAEKWWVPQHCLWDHQTQQNADF